MAVGSLSATSVAVFRVFVAKASAAMVGTISGFGFGTLGRSLKEISY